MATKIEKTGLSVFFPKLGPLKLCALILSIYVMAITLLPCEHAHNEDQHSHHNASHNEENEESSSSHCSPFCVCACVKGIEVTYSTTFLAKQLTIVNMEYCSVIVENLHSDFVPSFWQPPKL